MSSRPRTSPELPCGSRSCDEAYQQASREISDLRCVLEGALKVQEDNSEEGQHEIRFWQNITAEDYVAQKKEKHAFQNEIKELEAKIRSLKKDMEGYRVDMMELNRKNYHLQREL
jgi:polyhydroxyalkanoate synthesis regulator phasin